MTERRVNNIGVFLKSLLREPEDESGSRRDIEASVLESLSVGSRGMSDLLRETGAKGFELQAVLTSLTAAGLVRQNEMKEFELTEQRRGS
jgi:hypothetical protein